jgi:hypothetical protein
VRQQIANNGQMAAKIDGSKILMINIPNISPREKGSELLFFSKALFMIQTKMTIKHRDAPAK